jgi:hypothetical protein
MCDGLNAGLVVLDEQKHDRSQGDGDAQVANVAANLIAAFNEEGELPFYVDMAITAISEELPVGIDLATAEVGDETYDVIELYVRDHLGALVPYLDRTI